MKLILARVLPVAFALLVPSLALAETPAPKAHATHTAKAKKTAKSAKSAKPHKAPEGRQGGQGAEGLEEGPEGVQEGAEVAWRSRLPPSAERGGVGVVLLARRSRSPI